MAHAIRLRTGCRGQNKAHQTRKDGLSFQRKDKGAGGPGGGKNFHGEQRRNDTYQSKTDPESRLYRKFSGQEAN